MRRSITLVLAILMVLTLLPAAAFTSVAQEQETAADFGFAGMQEGTRALRLIGFTDSLSYDTIGFTVTVTGDATKEKSFSTSKVFTSLYSEGALTATTKETDDENVIEVDHAYLYGVAIVNITDGEYVFEVTPVAAKGDETVNAEAAKLSVTVADGKVTAKKYVEPVDPEPEPEPEPEPVVTKQVYVNGNTVTTNGTISEIIKLFDNNLSAKMCEFNTRPLEIKWELDRAETLVEYVIVSGEDQPVRDPKTWTLYGSADGETWVVLDEQTNDEAYAERNTAYTYVIDNETAYQYYKWIIDANFGTDPWGNDILQVQELQLFVVDNGEESEETMVEIDSSTIQSDAAVDGDQGVAKLFDNSLDTKACIVNVTSLWVSVQLKKPAAVSSYKIGSANDHDPRDPKDWILYGSNDGETWVELDKRTEQDLPARNMLYTYSFENTTEYGYYKLAVLSNNGKDGVGLDVVQFSEWQLYAPATEAPSATQVEVDTATVAGDASVEGGEGLINLFDGNLGTKACVAHVTSLWVSVKLNEAAAVNMYKIGSANDHDPRDPKDWILYGSNDGETWVELDKQTEQDLPARNMLYTYSFENTTEYSYYKLAVLSNNGKDGVGLDVVQFSEWQLFVEG